MALYSWHTFILYLLYAEEIWLKSVWSATPPHRAVFIRWPAQRQRSWVYLRSSKVRVGTPLHVYTVLLKHPLSSKFKQEGH